MNTETADQVEKLTKQMYKANNLAKIDIWKDRDERIDTDVLQDIIDLTRELELNNKYLSKEEQGKLLDISYDICEFTRKYKINSKGNISKYDDEFNDKIKETIYLSNILTYIRDYLIDQYLADDNKESKSFEYQIFLDGEAIENLEKFITTTFPIYINRRVTEILNYKIF